MCIPKLSRARSELKLSNHICCLIILTQITIQRGNRSLTCGPSNPGNKSLMNEQNYMLKLIRLLREILNDETLSVIDLVSSDSLQLSWQIMLHMQQSFTIQEKE